MSFLFVYSSMLFFVFFFKQKTAYEMRISDWSSDVCSSDLKSAFVTRKIARRARQRPDRHRKLGALLRRRYHRRMDIGLARDGRGAAKAVGDMFEHRLQRQRFGRVV